MIATGSLSARDRVDGFSALGLTLYLDDDGQLQAHGPQRLIDAARPAILQDKAAIQRYLHRLATATTRRADRTTARSSHVHPAHGWPLTTTEGKTHA